MTISPFIVVLFSLIFGFLIGLCVGKIVGRTEMVAEMKALITKVPGISQQEHPSN